MSDLKKTAEAYVSMVSEASCGKDRMKKEEKAECPKCEGTGKVDGDDCDHCDGKGYHDNVKESVSEKYNYKADALTAYFKGKIDAKELDKIARDDFKSAIATKKELSNFLSNKFTQDVMSDTYGIPVGTLIKRVKGLMQFAESVGESVSEEVELEEAAPPIVTNNIKKAIDSLNSVTAALSSAGGKHASRGTQTKLKKQSALLKQVGAELKRIHAEALNEEVELEEKKLDPVNDKENDKKFKDRKDKDIDNDGDVDSSDEYLHKRRAATDDAIDGGKKPADNADDKKKKDKNPKTSDSTAEISKIESVSTKESFELLWDAIEEAAINQKKGATEPEKMDSKASGKEKEFVAKHPVDSKDHDDMEKIEEPKERKVKKEMREYEVIRALLSGNPTGE